jgi:hypothetical protein
MKTISMVAPRNNEETNVVVARERENEPGYAVPSGETVTAK